MEIVMMLSAFLATVQALLTNFSNTSGSNALTNLGIYVTGPNSMFERFSLTNLSEFPSNQFYNIQFPTILYCYGYTDNFTSLSVDLIVAAYKSRGGFNILIIDWSDYDTGNYISVISNMHSISNLFGESLYSMHVQGLINLSMWHFIGHSLGAHMVGFTARRIQETSKKQVIIPRITALDPAGPGFYEPIVYNVMKPLSKSDGEMKISFQKIVNLFYLIKYFFILQPNLWM